MAGVPIKSSSVGLKNTNLTPRIVKRRQRQAWPHRSQQSQAGTLCPSLTLTLSVVIVPTRVDIATRPVGAVCQKGPQSLGPPATHQDSLVHV